MGQCSGKLAHSQNYSPSTCIGDDSSAEEKIVGLVNYSNTCYINSVLQALYFCLPFRRAVLAHRNDRESLLQTLADLFDLISSHPKATGTILPKKFLAQLRKENSLFRSIEHQDAHEFLNYLLNKFVDDLKSSQKKRAPQAKEHPTWVQDIFEGTLLNETKCLCCENITIMKETFLDLSVDIAQDSSISACLENFESAESLRGNNKFFCDHCACLQEAEKTMKISKVPKIFALHLKRFKYIERVARYCRLPYRVVFPNDLRVEQTPEKKDAKGPTEVLLKLRAIVVHIGTDLNHGHYVSVVESRGKWLLFDDEMVREIEEDALKGFFGVAGDYQPCANINFYTQPGAVNEGARLCYLLFYEQVEQATASGCATPNAMSFDMKNGMSPVSCII